MGASSGDGASRPDLAALDVNLLVISSALHRNFQKWMGNRPCKPKDFVDYLLRNEFTHFEGRPATRGIDCSTESCRRVA
ncbi:MAG: hypothetical protein VKI42_00135 [Synechococcaceae cyanobacterium]|nr:hypothetical protein [Synechococcaceae cyanobacterium]